MPEGITAESLMNNIIDTISDSVVSKHKNTSEGEDDSVSAQFNRLFGRQKPIHNLLGGGKSADVLLWRDKKLTAGSLGAATLIWVLFEWLNYHFLTLLCFAVVLGMVVQFLWKNASSMLNRDPSSVPRLILPEEVFVKVGKAIGSEVNRGLNFLQDVACKGTLFPCGCGQLVGCSYRRKLVQSLDSHIHRLCCCSHFAHTLREIRRSSGQLCLQRIRSASRPLQEVRRSCP